MEKLKRMPPEVLIYVQNLKQYFDKHQEDQDYFTGNNDKELFFKQLLEVAEKNFNESGEPNLTIAQFEELRKNQTSDEEKKYETTGIFVSFGEFGFISLN
jgi:hypothetical protein